QSGLGAADGAREREITNLSMGGLDPPIQMTGRMSRSLFWMAASRAAMVRWGIEGKRPAHRAGLFVCAGLLPGPSLALRALGLRFDPPDQIEATLRVAYRPRPIARYFARR